MNSSRTKISHFNCVYDDRMNSKNSRENCVLKCTCNFCGERHNEDYMHRNFKEYTANVCMSCLDLKRYDVASTALDVLKSNNLLISDLALTVASYVTMKGLCSLKNVSR
jgi:hypothetical protein